MSKIIIFNAGSYTYGAEKGLLNLLRALKDDHTLTVVIPVSGFLEKEIKGVSPRIVIKKFPLPVAALSLSPFYLISFMFLSLANFFYFLLYIHDHDIDVICTNSLLLFFPACIARLLGIKHIWFIREFTPAGKINILASAIVQRLSSEIICQSQTIKERMDFGKEASIIYEPITVLASHRNPDVLRKKMGFDPSFKIISVVSRIHPGKGQYEFLKNIKDFLIRRPDVRLLIAGNATPLSFKNLYYKRKLEVLVRKNNLTNVMFLGFRRDAADILGLSDICVFPFLRDEPFGIAVAEALALGKTTFFPRRAGLREVYKIFARGQPFNITAIEQAVDLVAENRKPIPDASSMPPCLRFEPYKKKIDTFFRQ